MGSSFTKDSNVTIFMNVNKQYYVAGEFIEGEIYLNVKADRPYSNLSLFIIGDQSVTWSEHHGKTTVVYTNSYDNYDGSTIVADFKGLIKKGQYSIPFMLQIPNMMTGSFYISRFCHIRYMLKAVMVHQTSKNDNQVYEMFLNILEPPRMPLDQVQLSNTVQSKCCGCCLSYGTMTATMMCDKNFVRSGDKISVKGIIDNTKGKKKVNSASVVFQQCLFQIASNQYNTNLTVQKQFTLHRFTTPTQIGQRQQFSFSAQIPTEIIDCTAIGRIVSRYFVLYLDTDYGCCANTVDSAIHLIVHSKSPVVVQKKALTPPPGWNPIVFPKVQCPPMKPYIYTPLPQLPFLNLPGQNNVSVNLNMESEMNMMQKNVGYEIGKEIIFNNKGNYDYQPQYYDQGMFSQEQSVQQGYQPYFTNEPDSQQILRQK